jgi:uncharacterized lipoprotein
MKKTILLILPAALSLFASCNKAILYSKDREMEPVTKVFSEAPAETYQAAKRALLRLGYKIHREDEGQGTIETGWLPTKASSHYVDLFDRQDYGTVGAYYKIQLAVREKGAKAEVEISAPVRSIVGRIKSAGSEEKKVLNKIADLLRKEDFEITNVGVQE